VATWSNREIFNAVTLGEYAAVMARPAEGDVMQSSMLIVITLIMEPGKLVSTHSLRIFAPN
jgi:hypothetical protein